MAIITNLTIDAAVKAAKLLDQDVWKTEDGARGEGRFRARVFPSGDVAFYYRYSNNGKQVQLRLEADGLAEARAEAAGYATLYRKGIHDLHLHVKLEAMAKTAQLRVVQLEEDARARQGTFAQLLDAYVVDMERRGKTSAREVRGALVLNVLTPFPGLAATPAKDVLPADVANILRHCLSRPVASKGKGKRLTKANATNGKKRQAAKLRSYLQAAFTFGLAADLNPQRPASEVQFGLTVNPARDVPTIEGANRAETWALTKDELRAVLLAVDDLPERRRSIAKAMLYLAGQRVEMLARATWADLLDDPEHGPVLRLVDLKGGKGTPPRDHLLPVTERLQGILQPLLAMQDEGKAPGPFSLRGGVAITPGTAQKIFAELGERLSAEGKTRRFTWLNIRVTVETHLASLGVDKERRAWLLSHGRSGVQAKHYDRYSYLPEKRQDLDKWARYLDTLVSGEVAKVVQLRK